jgi:hypothetical protein
MSPMEPPRVDEPKKRDGPAEAAYQKTLEELRAEWDARLRPIFDAPDFAERVDAVMDACGRAKVRPKAGESF